MITPTERIAALRALREAASPGEWQEGGDWRETATGGDFFIPSTGPDRRRWNNAVFSDRPGADSRLIPAAVNALPVLLDVAEAADRLADPTFPNGEQVAWQRLRAALDRLAESGE